MQGRGHRERTWLSNSGRAGGRHSLRPGDLAIIRSSVIVQPVPGYQPQANRLGPLALSGQGERQHGLRDPLDLSLRPGRTPLRS